MNIKILESYYFNLKTNELLQQYLIKHHLPKIGFYHVVAIKDHAIMALGMLYTSKIHPHRDYILFHDLQNYLEPSLFSKLINFLEKNSKLKRLQLLLNSRDTHLHELLESHSFYIARTSYLIELTRLNGIIIDTRTIRTKSLNHMSVDELIKLKKLFLFNYSRYHESVNRLAQEISPDQLFAHLENINLVQSRILLNSHDDPCAYIIIGNSDDHLVEITYIGVEYEDRMNYYLAFFQHELKTLLKNIKLFIFD